MNAESHSSLVDNYDAFRYCLLVLLASDRPCLRSLEAALNLDPELRDNLEKRQIVERLVMEARSKEIPLPNVSELNIRRNSNGVISISSPDWPNGEVLAMERNTFEQCRGEGNTFPDTAVYFLHTDRVTAEGPNELYIGESKDVNARVSQHQGGKKFWTNVLVASHRDMTKSHAKAVESELITTAKKANRFNVVNGNNGQAEIFGDHDKQFIRSVVAGLSGLLALARYEFLKPAGTGLFTYIQNLPGRVGTLTLNLRLVDAARKEVAIQIDSQIWAPRNTVPIEIVQANLESHGELRGDAWVFTKESQLILPGPLHQILGKSSASFKSQNGVSLHGYL